MGDSGPLKLLWMTETTPVAPVAAPPTPGPLAPAVSAHEIDTARGHVEASRAVSTRWAYDGDWQSFSAWCQARNAPALPASPALVAVYLSALAAAGQAPPSTVGRKPPSSITTPAPATCRRTDPSRTAKNSASAAALRSGGVSRERRMPARASAITMPPSARIAGDELAALSDRALLALGMALAARRSELVALEMRDLAWGEQGLRVTIRRSKTDREGEGAVVAVPEGRVLTPLVHLRSWLAASGITEGPVFRPLWKGGKRARDAGLSDHAVARILQARVQASGLILRAIAGTVCGRAS